MDDICRCPRLSLPPYVEAIATARLRLVSRRLRRIKLLFFFLFFFFWKGFCLIFSFIVCKDFRFLFYSLERFPFSLLLSVKISAFSFILLKDFRFLFYSLERFPFSLLIYLERFPFPLAQVHFRRVVKYILVVETSTTSEPRGVRGSFSVCFSGKIFRFL